MADRSLPTAPLSSDGLTGVQKTAVLLLSLPETDAAALLRRIPEEQIDTISAEMARMADVAPCLQYGVLQEFRELAQAAIALPGPASRFAFLEQASVEELVSLLAHQPPRTTALVLANLPPALAGKLLVRLSPAMQIGAVRNLPAAGAASTDELQSIEAHLVVQIAKASQHGHAK